MMKIAILVFALLLPVPVFASGCEAIVNARIKGLTVPVRSEITFLDNEKFLAFTVITVGGKTYSKMPGQSWKVEPSLNNNPSNVHRSWDNAVCTSSNLEIASGESLDVVRHEDDHGSTVFWISSVSGLVVRQENDMKHAILISVEEYRDVQVPTIEISPQ